eukprot:scaffold79_cov259-Pinguiococcus_pyrenoidosus.AAC.46
MAGSVPAADHAAFRTDLRLHERNLEDAAEHGSRPIRSSDQDADFAEGEAAFLQNQAEALDHGGVDHADLADPDVRADGATDADLLQVAGNELRGQGNHDREAHGASVAHRVPSRSRDENTGGDVDRCPWNGREQEENQAHGHRDPNDGAEGPHGDRDSGLGTVAVSIVATYRELGYHHDENLISDAQPHHLPQHARPIPLPAERPNMLLSICALWFSARSGLRPGALEALMELGRQEHFRRRWLRYEIGKKAMTSGPAVRTKSARSQSGCTPDTAFSPFSFISASSASSPPFEAEAYEGSTTPVSPLSPKHGAVAGCTHLSQQGRGDANGDQCCESEEEDPRREALRHAREGGCDPQRQDDQEHDRAEDLQLGLLAPWAEGERERGVEVKHRRAEKRRDPKQEAAEAVLC